MEQNKDKKHIKEMEFVEFSKFCSLPFSARESVYGCKTFQDFGEKYGVSKDCLTDWRKEDRFWVLVREERKNWFRDKTSEVVNALYRTILKKGGANEVNAWFRLIEGEKDEMNINVKNNDENPILNILKNQNGDKRKQTIEYLTQLFNEAAEGGDIPDELTDTNTEGDIRQDTEG